jgi:hypothetical protein
MYFILSLAEQERQRQRQCQLPTIKAAGSLDKMLEAAAAANSYPF